jgi:3'-phosphoadenosine 5'-phosphosulfate (PAPS) 3'-phosphatase
MKAIQRLLGLQILCLSIAIQFATAFATLPDHRTSPSRRRRPQHFASDDNIIIEELPLDYPRRKDVLIAIEAVRKACSITRQLQPITDAAATTIGTVQKSDFSPVTVADYAVQSVVLDHLNGASFPHCDGFIAEEDSASLRADEDLCKQVMHATGTILLDRDAVLAAIDLGKSYKKWEEPSHERPSRVWCLDPIDGTRGFLRGKRSGGQYCVALALLENGKPTIGVLGCPNLPTRVHDEDFVWRDDETEENNQSERGCIFVASRGGGCYQLPLFPNGQSGSRLQVTPSDGSSMPLTDARFCIGVEKYSDALGQWYVVW